VTYPDGFSEWPEVRRNEFFAVEARAYHERAASAGGNARAGRDASAPWPAPMPIASTLPPVAPFSVDLLPKVLADYVFDVADRQQSPPDFVAVAALCGLSSVIGNKVRIRPKEHDDWEIVPNLWGAPIGPPSAMKTPAMRSALGPIYALQDRLRNEWEAAQCEAAMEDALSNLDAKDAKKKAEKALKGGDRDEAKRLLKEANGGAEREDVPCPRLVVNDATVEKLGELMNQNPRGLLLVRDVLPGFLARLESEDFQSERAPGSRRDIGNE
jgi:hypothetical protein